MRKFSYILLFLFSAFAIKAQTVAEIVINSPDHETLEAAVIAAGLAPALSDPDASLTVFAPTDAAFAALPAGTVDALLQDPTGDLAKILLYHVVGAKVMSSDLSNGQSATTLLGQNIEVTINMDGVFINNAKVTVADIPASNGVVHVLDAVILPPASTVADVVINSDVHQTLEAAVIAAELAAALSDMDAQLTVFAPTDDAFAALPAGTVDALLQDPTGDLAKILLHHVASGEALSTDLSDGMMVPTLLGQTTNVTINADGVFIGGAKVTVADIRTFNGVVHVVDAVIMPQATVADVVINSDVHTTLETAVIAAGLAPALSDPDANLTVFAPTDDAFAALPPALLDGFLADPTGILQRILLYHVVGAEVLSSDLTDGMMANTLLGQGIEVTINADGVFINDAQVVVADIQTLNGVVHVIDAIIQPESRTVAEVVVNSPMHETLEAAVIAAGLAPTLSDLTAQFTVFAPTDDAFAALPPGTVDALLQDPTGDLAQILLYHVLGAEVLSSDLSDGQMAMTVQGQEVMVTIDNDGVLINNARVSVADIRTFNGVVHVIDAVILPNLSSVADLEITPATIAPNPASDVVNIQLPENAASENVQITMMSLDGKLVKNINATGNQFSINVSDVPAGMYLLRMISDSSISKSTLVVE